MVQIDTDIIPTNTHMPALIRRNNPELNDILDGKSTVDSNSSEAQERTPIMEPHENDILMGRGGKNNQHIGNERLRGMARLQSENYRLASKKGKSLISRELVRQVRMLNPSGRFLKKDNTTGEWEDVGDDVAREKASQVLRDAVSGTCHSTSDASEEESEQGSIERSRSAPPMAQPSSRRRTWHETRGYQSTPHQISSSPIYPPMSQSLSAPIYPHVTHSSHSSPKRRRYLSDQWDERLVSRMQATPIRQPGQPYNAHGDHPGHPRHPVQPSYYYPQRSASYSAPPRHYASREVETSAPPPVEAQGGLDEFDLFNGELLHSDDEDKSKDPPPPIDLHSDTFSTQEETL